MGHSDMYIPFGWFGRDDKRKDGGHPRQPRHPVGYCSAAGIIVALLAGPPVTFKISCHGTSGKIPLD